MEAKSFRANQIKDEFPSLPNLQFFTRSVVIAFAFLIVYLIKVSYPMLQLWSLQLDALFFYIYNEIMAGSKTKKEIALLQLVRFDHPKQKRTLGRIVPLLLSLKVFL